jgi:uncharacterized YigZ family protein
LYRRPSQRCRTEYEEKRSRFVTTVAPVTSVAEARAFLAEIRAEMSAADHHVYAFCVGYGRSVTEGMSDDGEPSGTSGPPTLAVLRGSGLGDVALVTSRFFGGTKLGTGGLVRAYTEAARLALQSLPTEISIARQELLAAIPYDTYNAVRRLASLYEAEVLAEDFGAEITLSVRLPLASAAAFHEALRDLTNGRAVVVITDP